MEGREVLQKLQKRIWLKAARFSRGCKETDLDKLVYLGLGSWPLIIRQQNCSLQEGGGVNYPQACWLKAFVIKSVVKHLHARLVRAVITTTPSSGSVSSLVP